MAVGDITSNEKGTAARYNDGKPDMGLIPLKLMADYFETFPATLSTDYLSVVNALGHVGEFQMGGDVEHLHCAINELRDWVGCAKVFEFGKAKYAPWNWAKGFQWSVPIACIGRHARYILQDQEWVDQDSGLGHVGHIMCNIIMLLYFYENYKEGDDRFAI